MDTDTTDPDTIDADTAEPAPPDPLVGLTCDALEDRLACLAARIAAAECEFLLLLAEFDAREGWGRSGMKSAAHWLSWRTGLRPGVARERVRVARALRALPLVRLAFSAGRLSYCKVRALSRVATPPTEADLVEIALGSTGAQLERICRAWRTCLIGETAASSHLRRGLERRQEDDGSIVFTLRLAPEEAAVVDAALEAARRIVLDDDGRPIETPEESQLAAILTDEGPAVRAEADAFVLIAESFLASGPQGDAGDQRLVVVHTDIDALADDPETPPATGDVSAEASPSARPVPEGTSIEQASRSRRPPGSHTSSGQPLSRSTVLRLLCHSSTQLMVHARDGRPLDLGRTRRHASRMQRRALAVRDGCCRFPGCTQRRRLIPHHTHWWSRGGPTDIDLLVLLCPTHHRAVHEIGFDVRALGAGRFAWRTPAGQSIPQVPHAVADPVTPLTSVAVTPDTIAPTWGGEALDLSHLIDGMASNLLTRAGHRLADVPYPDLDPAVRAADQWPEPVTPPPWAVDHAA